MTAATLLLFLAQAATPAATYVMRLDRALATADVEFCLGDWPRPPSLVSSHPGAERFRSPARAIRGDAEVVDEGGEIALRGGEAGDCLAYEVDLARLGREGGERALRREGASILTSSELWLWRPAADLDGRRVLITFELPPGVQASVPWPPAGEVAGRPAFRLTPTPPSWRDLTAFGRLNATEIEGGSTRLRLAIADAVPPADAAAMAAWIGEAARAVGTLYGRFPLPSPQVVVVPIGRRAEPVPWAQVQRGGGAAAHFFVDQHRPLEEFREDWTATHELSHMLLPYVQREDAWLSEGIASYYQNVLRARAGMLDPASAWEKLYAGFGRGRGESGRATLAAASRDMHRRGAFMQVYWSGAAIALSADVALRSNGGEPSLDLALARLAECCLPSYRVWTAREIVARLDDLTGTGVFTDLYDRWVDAADFPALAEVSAALGITESGGALRFDDDEASAALRRAIMSPPDHLLAEPGWPDGRDATTTTATGAGDGGGTRRPAP